MKPIKVIFYAIITDLAQCFVLLTVYQSLWTKIFSLRFAHGIMFGENYSWKGEGFRSLRIT